MDNYYNTNSKIDARHTRHYQLSIISLFIVAFSLLYNPVHAQSISSLANNTLLKDSSIASGHIGISIYEPATNKYLYNYNATKYFVPSSNTKLFTLYAGMKYLGDSLVGLDYTIQPDSGLYIYPAYDPTFLDPEFPHQPVYDFLKKFKYIGIAQPISPTPWGNGWVWDDLTEDYAPPRSSFPIYKNLISLDWVNKDSITVTPHDFQNSIRILGTLTTGFETYRDFTSKHTIILNGKQKHIQIPFTRSSYTDYASTPTFLLQDTLKISVGIPDDYYGGILNSIHSQPCDTFFNIMMHKSDNFFAEQTLLMVAAHRIGTPENYEIIDTLLKNDLKDVPQKPRWVDGCGLSRYDLFTPQDFVYIINKMKNEFGLKRLENILPTGNEGTLKGYYVNDSSFIYAKTGSMSNHFSLSGLLITKKNKTLVFSILVNDFPGSTIPVKRAIEQFIETIRNEN
jgi:serine-type D-Ala-D-Ala carboxypeptidase/endopeptidase (penicillin-binding protein 4)